MLTETERGQCLLFEHSTTSDMWWLHPHLWTLHTNYRYYAEDIEEHQFEEIGSAMTYYQQLAIGTDCFECIWRILKSIP